MSQTLPIQKPESIDDELQRMQDCIMRRAYEIFRDNGYAGTDLNNWLAAERELIWKPAVEITEKDNAFTLTFAIPGMSPEDLMIEVTPDEILVKGETREERKEEGGKVYSSEIKTGSLFRAITFPKKVNPDMVKAELKDGMLKVTAPLATEPVAKTISIQAA